MAIRTALIFLILLCSCEKRGTTLFTGNTMTIDYKIIVGQLLNAQQEQQIQEIIRRTFTEVDSVYNKWNAQSELSKLNQLHGGIKQKISPELEKLLQLTNHVVIVTEGRFDPTIEPLQQLWKKSLAQGQVPDPQSIEKARSQVGWNKIHLEDGFFWKDSNAIALDLGGIAKGYAVDLLTERLEAAGYSNLYVEWGGEIRTAGEHPEHRPWKIFISRLDDADPAHALAHLDLSNQAIATSGDYLQYWTVGTKTYFHIIDPRTGYPLEARAGSIASSSVLGSSCAFADGIATALLMFEHQDEAAAWASSLQKENPGLQFWLLSREETIQKAL